MRVESGEKAVEEKQEPHSGEEASKKKGESGTSFAEGGRGTQVIPYLSPSSLLFFFYLYIYITKNKNNKNKNKNFKGIFTLTGIIE